MTHYRERLEAGEFDAPAAAADLDAMTKQQLLEHARSLGVTPANQDMTKEELRAAIEAKGG